MNVSGKTIFLYFTVLTLTSGCTKMSPELGFGFLNSPDESLTIESNLSTINSASVNSVIELKGLCENNTNLTITAPTNFEFRCENLTYAKEIPAKAFVEGDNFISVEAFDNSKNKIATKKIKIFRDTVAPTVTLVSPTNIPGTDSSVALNGTCSENDLPVVVKEINSNSQISTQCIGGIWSLSFLISPGFNGPSLIFTASHADGANNSNQTNSQTVTRNVLSSFTISGVKNSGADTYSNLLKRLTGDLIIGWSSATGASSYDVYVLRNYPTATTVVCSQFGISGTSTLFALQTTCNLTHTESLHIKVVAWDSLHSGNSIEYLAFSTKAPATIRNDARILYINSDPDTLASPVVINYSDLVYDDNSSGPFTITIADSAGLGSAVTVDNVSTTRALTVSPTTSLSGIFPVQIQITDENLITSAPITVKIAIVYPYSWTGRVSSDFSDKDNWCGTAGLKTGCSGAADVPNYTNRVFIDNLCHAPNAGLPQSYTPNCVTTLSANTTVRSLFLKASSFSQNGFVFSAGTLNDSLSYFKMSGGTFNDGNVSGDLNIFKLFYVDGGLFNAPKNSTILLNTKNSPVNSEAFKVTNSSYFVHNNSTLMLVDPNGQAMNQFISVPSGFELYNFTVASTGGFWSIKSLNLVVSGNLTLAGAKFGLDAPLLNIGTTNAKISLGGHLYCTGDFGGGNLPVYIVGNSSKYKSIFSGCKFPQVKVDMAAVNMTEDSSATQDSIFQSLVVTGGSFRAPSSSRNLVISPTNLDTNTVVAGLNNGGFNHNNGKIIFQTADDSRNYKVSLPTLHSVQFRNANGKTSFFDIQNSFATGSFQLSGVSSVPLRGSGLTVTAGQLIFDIGLVADSYRITNFVQQGYLSTVEVNTNAPLNISNLEMNGAIGFSGTATDLNFYGTNFLLPTNDVSLSLDQQLKYYLKNGPYDFIGLGTASSGY